MKRRPLLIVSGCTRDKAQTVADPLRLEDFRDPDRRARREAALADYATPALEMYRGAEHLRLREAMDALETPPANVTHRIVSAGYGLLAPAQPLVPYDVTFDGMEASALEEWSRRLGLFDDVLKQVQRHEAVAIVLYPTYQQAVGFIAQEPGQRIVRLDPEGPLRPALSALLAAAEPAPFASVAEDARYLRAFESGALPKPLSHAECLRIAWLLAVAASPADAMERWRNTWRRHGYGPWHETAAVAWLGIVASRRAVGRWPCAFAFLAEHPQLLDPDYLSTFYSPGRLDADPAAERFVPPDRRPLAGGPL